MPAEDVFIVPGAIECDCGTCTGLHHTRAALFNVSLEHLATIEGEGELVNKVITSDRLLAQVQEAVNRVHNPHLYGIKAGQPGPQGRELLKGLQAGGNNNGLLFVDSNGSPSKDGDQTPRAKRMVTNPFGAPGTPSPPKEGKSKTFQTLVRARAAELGILRERDDVVSTQTHYGSVLQDDTRSRRAISHHRRPTSGKPHLRSKTSPNSSSATIVGKSRLELSLPRWEDLLKMAIDPTASNATRLPSARSAS